MHSNVKLRLVEMFINSLLGSMLMPFMVIYFAQNFGQALAGTLMVAALSLGVLASLVGGSVADKVGRKKILLAGEVFRLFCFVGLCAVNSSLFECPVITFTLITLISITFGFTVPAAQAMIIDATDEKTRKYVYGIYYWLFNLSTFAGSIFGGFLFMSHRFELLLASTVGSLLSFTLLCLIKELYTPIKTETRAVADYLKVLKDRKFIYVCTGMALLFSVEIQVRSYIAVKLSQETTEQTLFGWTVNGVNIFGILTAQNTLMVVLFGLVSAKLINNVNSKKALYFGGIANTLFLAALAVLNTPLLLLAAMTLATIGELTCIPVTQSVIANMVPDDKRSTYLSFNAVTNRIAGVSGSAAVAVGAFLPDWMMGITFVAVGVAGLIVLGRNI